MQAVAQVFFTGIPFDGAVLHEFEIDAVPVLPAGIPFYQYIPRIPDMDGIPGRKLIFCLTFYKIVPDDAAMRIFKIYAEKSVYQPVALYPAIAMLFDLNPCKIPNKTHPAVLHLETGNAHAVMLNGKDLIGAVSIHNGQINADDVKLFIDDDVSFPVKACMHDDHIPIRSFTYGRFDLTNLQV